jgi:hypothetical protein
MDNAFKFPVARIRQCGQAFRSRQSVGKEEPQMRSIPLVLAAFAFSAPAVAQSWEEYSYPEYAISVAFPARPRVETTTYQIADGRSLPARVCSVHQDKGEFKLMVADLAKAGLDEKAIIDNAIKALSQGGSVKVNIPARIYQVYGRQLTIEGGRQPVNGRAVRFHGAALSD